MSGEFEGRTCVRPSPRTHEAMQGFGPGKKVPAHVRAGERPPRCSAVGRAEHWASLVYARVTQGIARPMSTNRIEPLRELRSHPAWLSSAGDRTSSRGSGGEPGRPFSLVTFSLGEQKESHRHRGRPLKWRRSRPKCRNGWSNKKTPHRRGSCRNSSVATHLARGSGRI